MAALETAADVPLRPLREMTERTRTPQIGCDAVAVIVGEYVAGADGEPVAERDCEAVGVPVELSVAVMLSESVWEALGVPVLAAEMLDV